MEREKNPKWKRPVTVQLPNVFADALDQLDEQMGYGDRKKWALMTSALALLFATDAQELKFYVSQAMASDTGDAAFQALLERARSGELRRDAQARAAAAPATPEPSPSSPRLTADRRVGVLRKRRTDAKR